jgi:hypothetical protein
MQPARISQDSLSRSEWRLHEFAVVLHWAGAALLAYFLVDLIFQAWPVALLKPLWLDQMSGFMVSRSTTPLVGAVFVAAASEIDHRSTVLRQRSELLRRLALWVAIGYLLLIPVQIYAGVKLLRDQQQEATQLLSQATRAIEAIQASSTDLQLRQAYESIPGQKAPLPEQLPQPLSALKARLVEAMDARSKKAQFEFDQRLSTLWQRSLGLIFGNILRLLIFFAGFAALGRTSRSQPTLLTHLLNRDFKRTCLSGRIWQKDIGAVVPNEWLQDDKQTTTRR